MLVHLAAVFSARDPAERQGNATPILPDPSRADAGFDAHPLPAVTPEGEVCPAVGGGGKRFFPDGVRLDLELLEERRFANGVLILRYGVRGAALGLASGVKSSEILLA